MKIARETFHGPNRITVVAGEVFDDDADVVRRWPEKFASPEEVAQGRRHRAHHGRPVQEATARPGELSAARAVKPRKEAKVTAEGEQPPEGED